MHDYFKLCEALTNEVLRTGEVYFDRYIRNELEDYNGAFILAVSTDNADLLILDLDSNGSTQEARQQEMEYIDGVMFTRELPLYLYGHHNLVEVISAEQAFTIFQNFRNQLLNVPHGSKAVET